MASNDPSLLHVPSSPKSKRLCEPSLPHVENSHPSSPNTKRLCELSFPPVENIQQNDYELHGFLDGIFASMQTYQMEFDVENPKGRLPQCFVREYGDAIAPCVTLQDPNLNEIEVHVTKRSNK